MTTINQRTPADLLQSGEYDELVQAIEAADRSQNAARFFIGDAIQSIMQRGGTDTTITAIAQDSGLPRSTAIKYHKVAVVFPESERWDVMDTYGASYDVLHIATQAGDLAQAKAFLEQCRAHDATTSAQVQREMQLWKGKEKAVQPEQPTMLGRVMVDSFIRGGTLFLEIHEGEAIEWFVEGKEYRIDVWEVDAE